MEPGALTPDEAASLYTRIKSRQASINSRSIFIIDHVLDPESIAALHQEVSGLPYQFGEVDNKGDEFAISTHELDPVRSAPFIDLSRKIRELVMKFFPDETHQLYRSYINMVRYGDMSYPHCDASRKSRDVTALLYANDEWHRKYGGETHFYDYAGDNLCAVLPKPGRLVLFRGSIEHSGSAPSRICALPRYTVAYKFRSRSAPSAGAVEEDNAKL